MVFFWFCVRLSYRPTFPKKTDYKIKGGVIFQKCDACGEKSMVDMQHKLTTFILNRYAGRVHGASTLSGLCVCAWEGVKARQDTNADDGFIPYSFVTATRRRRRRAGARRTRRRRRGTRCVALCSVG